MFQSTPDLINRENQEQAKAAIAPLLFQSTPDLINRENTINQTKELDQESFNPLPI